MAILNAPATNCAKCLIFVLNVVFLVVAIILLAVGIKFYNSYSSLEVFIEIQFFSPAAIIISVGILLLLISFLGYVGVTKESVCMVNIYSFLLTILLILEISAAITSFIISSKTFKAIEDNMKGTMYEYNTNIAIEHVWDTTQQNFNCCGVYQPLDWASKSNHGISVLLNGTSFLLPYSCCVDPINCANAKIYNSGCWDQLNKKLSGAAHVLGYSVLNIAILQLIGIFFSAMLVKYLRKAKTMQELNRQTILSQLYNQKHQVLQPSDNAGISEA